MEEKHFFVVHTFISDETRKEYLTPPEKRDPPQKNLTEREWAERAKGQYARCMQEFYGNDEFFYCHWIAKSERDVYRQLEEFGLEACLEEVAQVGLALAGELKRVGQTKHLERLTRRFQAAEVSPKPNWS